MVIDLRSFACGTLLTFAPVGCEWGHHAPRVSSEGGAPADVVGSTASARGPEAATLLMDGAAAEQHRDELEENTDAEGSSPTRSASRPEKRFLGTFSAADVIRATGSGPSPELRWKIGEWHAHPNALVALSNHDQEFGGDIRELKPCVWLLQAESTSLKLVAQGAIDLALARCENDDDEPPGGDDRAPSFKLDLGRYAVRGDTIAIGVRFTCFSTSTTRYGSNEYLHLLEWTGDILRPIFQARVGSQTYDRPSFSDITTASTLSVLPTTSVERYRDLALRTQTTLDTADVGNRRGTPEKKTRLQTERFVWTGEKYQSRAR